MDSYNPFTAPEDPFDEEVQQPLTESQDSKIYNLLKPVTLGVFFIVFVIATVSLFTRPSTEIIVIQETLDNPKKIQQEPVVNNNIPSTTTTTTTTIFISPPTTTPQNITNVPVVVNQEEIIEKTVQIVAYDCIESEYQNTSYIGLGSGVLVSDKGHVLTNAHVLENCSGEIYIATVQNVDSKSEITYTAELLKIDTNLDLALLVVNSSITGSSPPSDFKYFEMKSSSELKLGESVEIWGYPSSRGDGESYSLNINLTKGTVSGFEQDSSYKRGWIVTDADISYGNSGGAALDSLGRLIGMPTFGVTEGTSWIGYLRTSDVLKDWSKEYIPLEEEAEFVGIPILEIKEIDLNEIPRYNREEWNSWIDEDEDCQNTRHEVLQLESFVSVLFSSDNTCYVQSGKWFDPYNGEYIYFASDLDIDHFVPLYNAHISGGWEWSEEKKTDFANNITDPDILIAVKNSSNREKSASSPDEWKPANEFYWCEYAYDWIRIKYEWNLSVTNSEWNALLSMLTTCPDFLTYETAQNENHLFLETKITFYEKTP
ncbi:trypsin-like peptidase domain-containing protein [bacterium]|nr:trypsin-like peptidase domain-containing protein [bacterium]